MESAENPLPDRHAPDLLHMLKEAVSLHQVGKLAEAACSYLQILEAKPDHVHAQRLLGVLRHQQGRHAEALDLIDAMLKANADDADTIIDLQAIFDHVYRAGRYADEIDLSAPLPDNLWP